MPFRLRSRSLSTPSPSRTRAVTPTAAERIASSHQTFPGLGSGDGPGSVLFTGLASKRVLKKAFSCFDRLSTNGKSPTIAMPAPFALSLSKGERRVFQQPVRNPTVTDGPPGRHTRRTPNRGPSGHSAPGGRPAPPPRPAPATRGWETVQREKGA